MEKNTLIKLGIKRFIGATREEIYLKLHYDMTKPETIRGKINDRCNFKCPYCYCWQRTEYPEISVEQWQLALLSLKEYIGNYVIQFSGGEPFVKKGFIDLLKFCHTNEIDWGVITNGSFFSQRTIDIVVDAKPLNIDISLDSKETTINDFVRGAKNSVNIISNGIDKLCSTRLRRDAKFLLRIKPTVTLQNYRDLPKLVLWAIERGVDTVDFAPVRPEPFWSKETYSKLWLKH
jgi:MoaA/NifB/PqqE/SkfB family radical SAM enzyme